LPIIKYNFIEHNLLPCFVNLHTDALPTLRLQ
jgi:hypothetical protein